MKSRTWMFLILLTCATAAFGQTGAPATQEDDGSTPERQMCIDCDLNSGGGWSGGSSYDAGRYVDNPCTSWQDLVWINYQAYANGVQPDAGVNRYQFNESTTMSGTYATSGTSNSDVAYKTAYTTRHYHKVNTSDNFHVVTVINFDPASRYTSVTMETACGDGTPSSAQ
ncbi:MAG TPA: hypothetical protein VF266_03545 [Thermoanaerobaculia bacterium]